MYAPNPPPQPEPEWSRPAAAPGIPPPPGYLPQPTPPQVRPFGREQAADRRWLRIPVHRPLLTPLLLALLVLIFAIQTIFPDFGAALTGWGAKNSLRITDGEWYRLITATFLHGGLLHILLNGYALYIIGIELEGLIGTARFAAVYAISGLAGSIASYAFAPFNVPGVGASGAIFGIVGALGVYFGLHRRIFGRMGNAMFWNIIIIIAINVAIGFVQILPGMVIDNSAHIGGLLAGIAAGFVLAPRYELGDWYNPLVRNLRNANRGPLPWVAATLIGLIVVFVFVVLLLMFRAGVLTPTVL